MARRVHDLQAKIAEAKRLAKVARGEDDTMYINDPEEGLEHLRVEWDGQSTFEVGAGPQPPVTKETIEQMIEERRTKSARDLQNLLGRKPLT